jgi:hypothetical protein
VGGRGGVQLGPSGITATNRSGVPDQGDYGDEEIGGMMIGRGNRSIFGENLPQCHFAHHEAHVFSSDSNPGRRGWKPATNRLSYGTALYKVK